MTPTAVTAFSLAYAIGAQKHREDGTKPPQAKPNMTEDQLRLFALSINRKPASNPVHPRHLRKGAYSARQWRICTRKSHDRRMFGSAE